MKKLNLNLFSLLIIFFLSFINLANSEERFINFSKMLVIVTDGDTIKLGDVKIRFSGIDAPEINQTCVASEGKVACGKISKDILKLISWPYLLNQASYTIRD